MGRKMGRKSDDFFKSNMDCSAMDITATYNIPITEKQTNNNSPFMYNVK
jgi:hypothetical protein